MLGPLIGLDMRGITEFAGRAIVPFTVVFFFALARKYLKPSTPLSEERLSSLDSRFQRTKWFIGCAIVAVAVLFAWATHYVLVSVNRYLAVSDSPEGSLHLWPQSTIWWFLPGFGAVALCWEITLQLWSAFGQPDTARLYRLWSDGRAGFDATRILRWVALVIVAPIGIFTILALPMHVTLRQRDIRVCGYAWAKCETFDYAKAMRMTQIDGFRDRDGKLHPRAGIVIDFVDSRRWSSADTGDFRRSVDPALLAFLAEHIHLPLEQAETESDIPKGQNNVGQLPSNGATGP
jgi:hypothetical protein